MKNFFFLLLAFFATNSIFSQVQQRITEPIRDSDGAVIYELLPQRETPDIYYSDELPRYPNGKAEEILQSMPMQDQIKLERYFQKKYPCPKAPMKKNPSPKPLPSAPPAPNQNNVPAMINIVNGTPGSVIVNKDGSVRVESYPMIQNGSVQMRIDTGYILNPPKPPAFDSGKIPLMPGNPNVGQNQFMFIWLLIGGLVAIIALALSGRLNTNQMH